MTEPDFDVPPAWRSAADRILETGWRTILVIGRTDIGKSTLCRYVGRRLLEAGSKAAMVDADIGQKIIGPPAAVTAGVLDGRRPLSESPPERFYFVGSTDPIRRMMPLVIGVTRLSRAADRPFVLVDTPGAVHGPGRMLQGWLIEAVRPDTILALEDERELAPILDAHRHCRMLRLPRSPGAKRKSAAMRTAARRAGFVRYFEAAADHRLDSNRLALQRTPRREAGGAQAAFAQGRLCGVADRDGEGLGLAILQAVDTARQSLTLLTPVRRDRIAALQFGDLRIGRDGHELRGDEPPKGA